MAFNTCYIDKYDMLPRESAVLCAVSGGADSVCLLSRMLELGRRRDLKILCAHFNHRLRGADSDADELYVRELCENWEIPFFSGSGDVSGYAKEHGLGTEEAARILRYAFLEKTAAETGADKIATAHTADDNAETMLLNLARGAGPRGLAGIPPARGKLIRPMLAVTRAEVEAYLTERGIPWRTDATNLEDGCARNRLRHAAVPLLRAVNEKFVQNAARAAELLREDDAFLESLARDFIGQNLAGENRLPAEALWKLPGPVSARVFRLMSKKALSLAHVEALRALCAPASSPAELSVPGMLVRRESGALVFGAKAPLTFAPRTILPGETVEIPEVGLSVSCELAEKPAGIYSSFNTFYFQCENIYDIITLRPRAPGDFLRPEGRGCTKTLKKLFSEARLPVSERERVLVLADARGVLAVHGFGADERCAAGSGEKAVKIEITKTGGEN